MSTVFRIFFVTVMVASLYSLFAAPCAVAQPDFYVDHLPDTVFVGDSCHPRGCVCGTIEPTGPDYKHSRQSGRNYDPLYDNDPAGAPKQADHVFDVPCSYRDNPHYDGDEDTVEPYVGCFMLGFTVRTCKDGEAFSGLEIKLRDQAKPCQNDNVTLNTLDTVGVMTLYDTLIAGKDTLITSRDSVIVNRIQPKGVITYDSTLGPNHPANSRIFIPFDDSLTSIPCETATFMFEVCDLWKWGHFPAEYDCPIVFEVTLKNANPPKPDCGTIPFVIWGNCNGGGMKIQGEGGELVEGTYVPNVGEVRIIRYEEHRGAKLE